MTQITVESIIPMSITLIETLIRVAMQDSVISRTLNGFIIKTIGKQTVATGIMMARLLLPVVNSISMAKINAKDMLFSMQIRICNDLLTWCIFATIL